jgi:hypothetical protein
VKYKVHMTVRGDQKVEGNSFDPEDIYAPVLKHYEGRLLLAIAAAEGCPVWSLILILILDSGIQAQVKLFCMEAWAVT